MLQYATVFYVLAMIFAAFGFVGIAAGAATFCKAMFFMFLIIAVACFIADKARR